MEQFAGSCVHGRSLKVGIADGPMDNQWHSLLIHQKLKMVLPTDQLDNQWHSLLIHQKFSYGHLLLLLLAFTVRFGLHLRQHKVEVRQFVLLSAWPNSTNACLRHVRPGRCLKHVRSRWHKSMLDFVTAMALDAIFNKTHGITIQRIHVQLVSFS